MSALSVGLRKDGLGFLVDGFDKLETAVTGIQVNPPGTVTPGQPATGATPAVEPVVDPVKAELESAATNVITSVGDAAKNVVESTINSKFPIGTQFTDSAVDGLTKWLEQATIHFLDTAIEHLPV